MRLVVVGSAFILSQFGAHGLGAQASEAGQGAAGDPWAGVTTDTGDFALGRKTFERYTTPQLCLGAATNVAREANRSVDAQLDALHRHETLVSDTLPAVGVELARHCAARFSISSTSLADLPDLFLLYLMGNQDSLARAASERWIASATAPADRDSVMLQLMNMYLAARPARAAAAEALVDRVAETGNKRIRWQIGASTTMMQFWLKTLDVPMVTRWAERSIRLTQEALAHAGTSRDFPGLRGASAQAYAARVRAAYVQHQTDSITTLLQRAKNDWERIVPDVWDRFPWDVKAVPLDSIARYLTPVPTYAGKLGEIYPSLDADYWYPARPSASGSTPLTLYIAADADDNMLSGCVSGMSIAYFEMGTCAPFFDRVRRLTTRYIPRGIRVIVVTGTHGMAAVSLPLPPDKEADRLRWYFLEYLKLPVTLAVVQRPVIQLPPPDGRRRTKALCSQFLKNAPEFNDTSTAACRYLSIPLVLLGHHGELLYAGGNDPIFDVVVENALTGVSMEMQSPTKKKSQ